MRPKPWSVSDRRAILLGPDRHVFCRQSFNQRRHRVFRQMIALVTSFLLPSRVFSQPFDFVGPLFSYSYELLFSQPLCFDIHPHCPGVSPSNPFRTSPRSVPPCLSRQLQPSSQLLSLPHIYTTPV